MYSLSKYFLSTCHEPGRHGCESLVTCLQSSHLGTFLKNVYLAHIGKIRQYLEGIINQEIYLPEAYCPAS